MRDPAGAVAGRIFAFRDISAERRVEQMKSDFVSTVSHELRTPLTSIYGFAETLLRAGRRCSARRSGARSSATSPRESERLTAIVDALLYVARLDTGDLQVQLAPTRRRARSSARSSTSCGERRRRTGTRFVVDLPDEPLAARGRRARSCARCSSQLVDNAVRYSPDGGTVTVGGAPAR